MTNKLFSLVSNGLIVTIILVSFYATTSDAHAYFSSITIDGVVHNEGDCTRPHPGSKYDYPISSLQTPNGLTSNDMTCGWLPAAAEPANRKCPVNPGSQIGLQWHYEMGLGSSDTYIIDPTHKGPCIVYMAKSETGSGNVWFKVFEDGYDTTTKKWCVDKLRANKGVFTMTIPTDITPGNYLMRIELIALHEGDRIGGAQPYVGCAEVTVGGSGTVNPGNLVAFPGAYTATDPGIHFDIYTGSNPPYPIPGPKLYVSGSAPSPSPTPTPSPTPVTTGKKSVTTGAKQGTTTTTGKSSTTTTTTTTGSSTSMCYLPGTPNLDGKAKSGTCGRKAPRRRCDDGQCCSQWGYCGPVPEDDGRYREYVDGKLKYVSEAFAFQLYCNDTYGDYRKVPCDSIQGGIAADGDNNKQIGASSSLMDVRYLRTLLATTVAFVFVVAYLF